MPALRIRPATPHEAPALSELALRSKAHWGYSEAFMRHCREELTVSQDEIVRGVVFVAERGAELVGFAGCDRSGPAQVELEYLFVEPRHIGTGVGRALMQRAIQQGQKLGARSMVIQGDPHAEAFYLAAGATRSGERASDSIPGRNLPLFELAL